MVHIKLKTEMKIEYSIIPKSEYIFCNYVFLFLYYFFFYIKIIFNLYYFNWLYIIFFIYMFPLRLRRAII
jgi:hypothetical protein